MKLLLSGKIVRDKTGYRLPVTRYLLPEAPIQGAQLIVGRLNMQARKPGTGNQ
ncbi:MAG TPA: hypothetical protein VGE79_15300 [Niastella sp.]